MRVYKKLGITSVEELKGQLENGEIEKVFGPRLARHVRQGVTESHAMLLYHADQLRDAIQAYLAGPDAEGGGRPAITVDGSRSSRNLCS
jgi:DNA polymerase (family 10)